MTMREPLDLDHPLLQAPFVVVGRSRSGTRVLAEVLLRSGVFMGSEVDPVFLDSLSWYQRFVVPLLTCRGVLLQEDVDATPGLDAFVQERLQDTLRRHLPDGDPVSPWGWKYPETLFLMSVLKSRLRKAQFIHVIRDGRDVVLSNRGYFHLTFFSLGNPPGWRPPTISAALSPRGTLQSWTPSFREFCLSVTFGSPAAVSWQGIDLRDPEQLAENKFLIQMQSWKHCVESARRCGREAEESYHEIRYERLCSDPAGEAKRLFASLGLELSPRALVYLDGGIRQDRLRRWHGYPFTPSERRDFANACEYGRPLLKDLGYDD